MLALKNNRIFYASMKYEANHGIKNFEERRIVKNKFIRIESFVKRRINMKKLLFGRNLACSAKYN